MDLTDLFSLASGGCYDALRDREKSNYQEEH
jgi:hypothetical protein